MRPFLLVKRNTIKVVDLVRPLSRFPEECVVTMAMVNTPRIP